MLLLIAVLAGFAGAESQAGSGAEPGAFTLDRAALARQLADGHAATEILADLHHRSWQACRADHRHGAMADRRTRMCARSTLDAAVERLALPALSEAHAPALHGDRPACDNKHPDCSTGAAHDDDRSDP